MSEANTTAKKRIRRIRHTGRGSQVCIYLGKQLRFFINENDWKVLPMAAIIAALVAMVIRRKFFVNMEGALMGGFALVMVCLIVIFNLVNSRSGRAIMASRDNRIAAESVGINVTRYKMLAFVTSSAMAGSAGALFALNYSTIVANKFDFNTSILVLVFVVFGGLGNMLGSVIAAAALTILPEALRSFASYRMLIYAIVLILVMLATNNPTLKGFFATLRTRFGKNSESEKEASGT